MAGGRFQLIFSVDSTPSVIEKIEELRTLSKETLILENTEPFLIDDIKDGFSFDAKVRYDHV